MSDLQPFRDNFLLPRDARSTTRTNSRTHAGALARMSKVDADADLARAKLGAYTDTVGEGMAEVTRISRLQEHLEQLSPAASGRLAFLADEHAVGVANTLNDLRRDLRRR